MMLWYKGEGGVQGQKGGRRGHTHLIKGGIRKQVGGRDGCLALVVGKREGIFITLKFINIDF